MKIVYADDFTGVCASKEEWHEAFEEFLLEHSFAELPNSTVLKWDTGTTERVIK